MFFARNFIESVSFRVLFRGLAGSAALTAALLAISLPSQAVAAHNEAMSPFDYARLCRMTAHVPLVQAGIDPKFIALWTIRESRQAGRYEQYSYGTRRIDVRANDEISLFHGLIHRTLDLIGESQLKYADAAPHEDHEHWLIYYTLETHWPGEQWRHGREPSRAALKQAAAFWTQNVAEYERIQRKAQETARHSWCATHASDALAAKAHQTPGEMPTLSVRPD